MLDYMRKNAGSKIVWLIIGAIAVVFVFFGIGGGGSSAPFITVNEEEAPVNAYRRALDGIREQYRQMGISVPAEAEQALREQAVSMVAFDLLLNQFANSWGLSVPPSVVADQIGSAFLVDGRFDQERYQNFVRYNNFSTPAEYEEMVAGQIAASQAEELIQGLAFVPPQALRDFFHLQEDQVSLEYAFFPFSAYLSGHSFTDQDLETFFETHKESWRRPEELKIAYVEFPFNLEAVAITDEELAQAYDEQAARRFSSTDAEGQTQVTPLSEVRETLLGDLKLQKARQLAVDATEDFFIRASTNPDLASVTASMGLTLNTSDFFHTENAPEFFQGDPSSLSELFEAELGLVIELPVETEDRLVVYSPTERRDSFIPELTEVRNQVAEAWSLRQAEETAQNEARAFIGAAQAGWEPAVAALSEASRSILRFGRTDLVSRTAVNAQELLNQADPFSLAEALLTLIRPGQVAESPLPVGGETNDDGGYLVVALAAAEAASDEDFETRQESLLGLLMPQKSQAVFSSWHAQTANRSTITVPPDLIEQGAFY